MKKISSILAFLLMLTALAAQTGTVKGTVLDQQSEMPVIGATVQLMGVETPVGAVTDIDGYFTLDNVPAGRNALQVQYVGYETLTLPNVEVSTGKDVILTLAIQEKISQLDEVVVAAKTIKDRPQNEMAAVSARQFSVEEVNRFSGGRLDRSHTVNLFKSIPMKTLIVEDEINAFQYLKASLNKIDPNIEVLAHLESVEDTVNWLLDNPAPDLIFLDIELSDGRSFEIFEHLDVHAPIIFTTAYDQYAIEAFQQNSIGYLLKPIHIDELRRALDKYNRLRSAPAAELPAQLQAVFRKLNRQKKLRCLVKKGSHYEFINIEEIACVYSEESLTFLHTFQRQRHLYTSTVEGLMARLDEQAFFRINRGQIVNINAIDKIHPYFNQRMKLELSVPVDGVEFVVSRARVGEFREWVDS